MALILSYANDITTRLMAREEPARYGSHPIRTRLTGHELGNTNDPRELRRLAREYAQRHFRRGLTVTNTETGWRICIAVRGVKHAISYHGIRPDIARSVPGLPSLIEGSTLGGSVQGDKEGEHTVHRFHGRLYIDTYLYEATILVKEDSQGKFYYDHRLTRVEPAAHPGEPMAEDTSHRLEPTTRTGSDFNVGTNSAEVHEICLSRLFGALASEANRAGLAKVLLVTRRAGAWRCVR